MVVPGITDSESENEAENERNNNATERTPLLGGGSNNHQNNDLIFPAIGRRNWRSVGRNYVNNQNNVPSTSNILQNNNNNNKSQKIYKNLQKEKNKIKIRLKNYFLDLAVSVHLRLACDLVFPLGNERFLSVVS